MADPLTRAIEQLYRVPLSACTRERNARATALRKAGQPAQAHRVQELRRPSAPLWATNQLAHEDPKRLAGFIDSVERVRQTQLRDPQAAGETLKRQRAELDALVLRAGDLLVRHGYRATPAIQRRISDTLLGAAVDSHRAHELCEGRLTQELSAPGFEVLAGAPRGRHLRLVPGGPVQGGQGTGSREAERRAKAEQERERRDREAEELERAAAVRQSAAIEVAREAEELARKLTAARARVREAQRASKAAATAARKARRGPRR
jgi:hypothetical protein